MDAVLENKEKAHSSKFFAAGSVIFFVVLGQGMNVLQEMLLAAYFGTTWTTDAYKLAAAIPMGFSLESIGIINAVVIPVLYTGKTFEEQRKIFSALLYFFLILSAALWLILILIASPLFDIIGGGFTAEGRSLAVALFSVTSSLVALTILATFAGNALNSRNEFGIPALQKAFMFGAIVPALAIGAGKFGIASAAWGAVLGLAVFLLLSFWRLFRRRLIPATGFTLKDPAIKQCIVLAAPLIITALFNQVNVLFEKKIAADFPSGTLSALDYALKSSVFFINFLGVGVSTVIFPTLSERNVEGDMRSLGGYAERLLSFVVLAVTPFIIFLLVFRTEFVQLLFERGAFTSSATAETSSLLGMYAFGLLGHAVVSVFPRFFQALRDNTTLMKIGIVMVGVNIAGLIVFPRLFGPVGIPVAFIVTYTIQAFVLLILLHTVIHFHWSVVGRELVRLVVPCFLIAGIFVGARSLVGFRTAAPWLVRFGYLAGISLVSVILYFAAASKMKVRIAEELLARGWDLLRPAQNRP